MSEIQKSLEHFGYSPMPKTMDYRYVTEDVPYGLIPSVEFFKQFGFPYTVHKALVDVLCVFAHATSTKRLHNGGAWYCRHEPRRTHALPGNRRLNSLLLKNNGVDFADSLKSRLKFPLSEILGTLHTLKMHYY